MNDEVLRRSRIFFVWLNIHGLYSSLFSWVLFSLYWLLIGRSLIWVLLIIIKTTMYVRLCAKIPYSKYEEIQTINTFW